MAARLTRIALVLATTVLLAACGVDGIVSRAPAPSPTPGPTLSAAVGPTIAAVTQALGNAGLASETAEVPYRPPEAPELATLPRWTLQVELRDEPTHGFVTIYELPDDRAAQRAAETQAAYVASGPGRVQFPTDTRFSIRRVGQTVVFYSWSPGSSTDPRAADVIPALERVGVEVTVPR